MWIFENKEMSFRTCFGISLLKTRRYRSKFGISVKSEQYLKKTGVAEQRHYVFLKVVCN